MALRVRKWTLAEVHRLPDDGNKYELVRGELFVTPPPGDEHETIGARLSALLTPYVTEQALGLVFHPRAVVRYRGSEVEPDLMVRREHPRRTGTDRDWNRAPVPTLVVEIASDVTRRRDRTKKRSLYLDAGVPEYWMIDADALTLTVARPGEPDRELQDVLVWAPAGATRPLTIDIASLFPA